MHSTCEKKKEINNISATSSAMSAKKKKKNSTREPTSAEQVYPAALPSPDRAADQHQVCPVSPADTGLKITTISVATVDWHGEQGAQKQTP